MDWKDSLKIFAEQNNLDPTMLPEDKVDSDTSSESSMIPQQNLEIILEKKGRGGKTATIIAGFNGTESQIRSVLKQLQQKIGTGGSARGNEILIQGDQRRKVVDLLHAMGHKVKGNIS